MIRLAGLYDLTSDEQFRCAQLRDGYLFQSEVTPEFLFKCAINGYTGNTNLAQRTSLQYTPPPAAYAETVYIPPPIQGVDRSTPDLAPGSLPLAQDLVVLATPPASAAPVGWRPPSPTSPVRANTTPPAAAAPAPPDITEVVGPAPPSGGSPDGREIVGGDIIDEIFSALPPEWQDVAAKLRAVPWWVWAALAAATLHYVTQRKRR